MADVVLDNVSKTYTGGVHAVRGITLHVADREFVVLVGPSGCGKSTTIRMVAGLEEISAGTISVGGRVVNHVPPKDRDIAMVFQNYALYPHMTVYKNLAFGLKLRGFPKSEIDQRVQWAAQILGITPLLERRPKALSGGERQRVAVGRAIVRQPKAFLFDEPLSNLDAKLRIETRAELKRLHQRLQTTTLYVTHDQEEAMTLGDRVAVMDAGQIQQCDAPWNVYRNPANRFVAGFLGTPPMNFFDGRLESDNTKLWFTGQGLRLPLDTGLAAGTFRGLAPRVDQPVVLGLRPEHLALQSSPSNTPPSAPLQLSTPVIEPLGAFMDLRTTTSTGVPLVARVPAESPVSATQPLTLHVDPRRLHLFAPGTHGENLTLPIR